MSNNIEKMYINKIVNSCKIITMNTIVIKQSNAKDIFMASLLTTIHYSTSSVEIIDRIIDSTDIKACEVTVMVNNGFSVIDTLLEYRDSIIKSYFKTFKITEYKFRIKNYL